MSLSPKIWDQIHSSASSCPTGRSIRDPRLELRLCLPGRSPYRSDRDHKVFCSHFRQIGASSLLVKSQRIGSRAGGNSSRTSAFITMSVSAAAARPFGPAAAGAHPRTQFRFAASRSGPPLSDSLPRGRSPWPGHGQLKADVCAFESEQCRCAQCPVKCSPVRQVIAPRPKSRLRRRWQTSGPPELL